MILTSPKVVVYRLAHKSGRLQLERLASYRTSTAPVDITVTGNVIAISDLMKSVCIVEFDEGKDGLPDKLTEVARHYQTVWSTGVTSIAEDTYLESDAEGNLIVLRRNRSGVEEEDRRRLEVTGEISLGEMVNRIRPVNIQSSATVVPRAFLGTVRYLQFRRIPPTPIPPPPPHADDIPKLTFTHPT